MATFLFWNMGKKALAEPLFRLAMRHEVDVLMLAECALSPGAVLEELNREKALFHVPATSAVARERVKVFTRFDSALLRYEDQHFKYRWTMRRLMLPNVEEILLVAVHLNSKLVHNERSQESECRDLADHIRRVEERLGHRRTLVVGDFNLNPFEAGMLGYKNLNSEPTQRKAGNKVKVEEGQEFPRFYNPMWNFFGDATRGPAGTFHYGSSQSVRLSWNMLDQVLLRPDLLPFFRIEDLEILTGDGENSFLTKQSGVPGANNGSDHLPIVFQLNLKR